MKVTVTEKSKANIIIEMIQYVPNSTVNKPAMKKSAISVNVMSLSKASEMAVRTSPFDTFAKIIEGKAEVLVDGTSMMLETGQSIMIPAYKPNFIKPKGRFDKILTVVKCIYE